MMTIRWSRVKLNDGEKWTAYAFRFDQRLVAMFKVVPAKSRMWWPGLCVWFVRDSVWEAFHTLLGEGAELHGWELMRDPLLGKRVVAEQKKSGVDDEDPFGGASRGPFNDPPPGPRFHGFADFADSYVRQKRQAPPPPPRRGNAVQPEDWRALHLLPSAPAALVKAAHRALVMFYGHPDQASCDAAKKAAEEKLKELNVARDRILASLEVDA